MSDPNLPEGITQKDIDESFGEPFGGDLGTDEEKIMTESKQYTWEKIEIKPNDQSLVGEVVKHPSWNPENKREEILCVGNICVFCRDNKGEEQSYYIKNNWLIRREVKKKEKKVWAFGWMYNNIENYWSLSNKLETEDLFLCNYFNHNEYTKKQWPAKMSVDGTFEEPEGK